MSHFNYQLILHRLMYTVAIFSMSVLYIPNGHDVNIATFMMARNELRSRSTFSRPNIFIVKSLICMTSPCFTGLQKTPEGVLKVIKESALEQSKNCMPPRCGSSSRSQHVMAHYPDDVDRLWLRICPTMHCLLLLYSLLNGQYVDT